MIAYHATDTKDRLESILKTNTLLSGKNVATDEPLVHLATKPFEAGQKGLQVISSTNEAWIIEFQIPDDTALHPNPSGESRMYTGCPNSWVVHRGPLSIQIVGVTYVSNVDAWVSRMTLEEYADWQRKRDAFDRATAEGGPAHLENERLLEGWGRLIELAQRLEKYSHLAR